MLTKYVQVTTEPTQTSGFSGGHVFIRKKIMQEMDLKNIGITAHFSDHNIILLIFKMKHVAKLQLFTKYLGLILAFM